jgi:phosphate starvation-inducible PhoH-like protein
LELKIPIEDPSRQGVVYGTADRNLRLIRTAFDVRISARDNAVRISGSSKAVHRAAHVIERIQDALRTRASLSDDFVTEVIEQATQDGHGSSESTIDVFLSSRTIVPRSDGQRAYLEAIRGNDLTFCAGPAGTGKTYLAVAESVSLLKRQKIERIVLVRPAVEAGEKLGYLPGDLQAKVNPYLRPLFDAMHDMMSFDQIQRFMQNDVIEVVPLAFMRGRTLNNAAIILDEAQNTTVSQMLMFLTRMGNHSKMIVTGDDSQSDLPEDEPSGFTDALDKLMGTESVAVVRLERSDIVRHVLVQRIVEAYGR